MPQALPVCVTGPVLPLVDTSFDLLNAAMADRTGVPSTFEDLPISLGLLGRPLPIAPHTYNVLSSAPHDRQLLAQLAVSIPVQGTVPAALCIMVSSALENHYSSDNQGSEQAVQWAVFQLVTVPMMIVLKTLGVDYYVAGDNAYSSGATSARQRPDVLLFFKDVLMFKVCLHCCHRQSSCLIKHVCWLL